MTKSIDAKDKSLKEILSNTQYSIDFYQRDYKWQTKQCEELISDLTSRFLDSYRVTHVRADVAAYPAYFLGSIVLSKKPEGVFVVDGQQRLTTLTLLLIFLRNLQVATDLAEDPNVQALIQSTQFGKKNFNMNVAERSAVIEVLYNGQIPDDESDDVSSANIIGRYLDIETFFPEECRSEALPFFMDWLIERVQLVEISAYSDEDAYTVFETMNDRGLSLSPADMLKGFLLSYIRDIGQRSDAEAAWNSSVPKLQALPAKDATNDFFRTWFRGRYATSSGPRGDYERLGPEFHRWLREKADGIGLKHSDDYFEFVTRDVPTYAKYYQSISEHQNKFEPAHQCEYFVGEARLDDVLLMLAAVKVSDSQATAEAKIRVIARYLDIFVYRRLWAGRNLTKPALKGTFVAFARSIRDMDLETLTARLYAELTKPNHDNFVGSPPVLTVSSRRKIHRLLARLATYVEVNAGSGQNPYADLVVVSGRSRFDIEHIWPNKWNDYRTLFADEAEFQDYRNRLGSLALIPHSFNISYNDKKTSEKIPYYGRLDHNLLVASLSATTYQHNPKFKNWLETTGFKFEAYDLPGVSFTKQSSDARVELFRELARAIWSPELVLTDSGLEPSSTRALADEIRGELQEREEEGPRSRNPIEVQVIDLLRAGLLVPGDILQGKKPGSTVSSTALVLENGWLELENGSQYPAVSTAAMSLGLSGIINGWTFWVLERSNKTLKKLREEYRQRLRADGDETLFGIEEDDED
jgi:hypothetical protein